MRVAWSLLVAAVTFGCGKFDPGPWASPASCPKVDDWVILGLGSNAVAEASLGTAALLSVHPRQYASPCAGSVAAVEWTSGNPAVVQVYPRSGGTAILSAVGIGDAQVAAAVTRDDGVRLQATSLFVRVAAVAAPAGRVVFEGESEIGSTSQPSRRLDVAFEIAQPGRHLMIVDWQDPLNTVTASLCPGRTSPPLGCVPVATGSYSGPYKPQRGEGNVTGGGVHSLWITNTGPAADRVRYEVRRLD
jgi:hypothetical protein